jgi:hypothetical protein
MLFTTLGLIVAVLALLWGISNLYLGVFVSDPALLARIGARSFGELIDKGLDQIWFAIALGILTEISRNIRANRATANEAMAGEEPAQAQKRANKVLAGWALALLGLIVVGVALFMFVARHPQ